MLAVLKLNQRWWI